jgi:hypothetical protein
MQKLGIPVPSKFRIIEDTTEFMGLDKDDVILLDNIPYMVLRNEKEIGFGLDNEPKYWVKRATNLESGDLKVVKLVFYEKFTQKVGDQKIWFFRNPKKEAAALEVTAQHPDFMQGYSAKDIKGNLVRIIEHIPGKTLSKIVTGPRIAHREYFNNLMPDILSQLSECLFSLSSLHGQGLVHGDVRWDHILFDRELKRYRWIDFDYDYFFPENPFSVDLFGIGKILAYVIGKGPYLYSDIKYSSKFESVLNTLCIEDFAILQQNLLMNVAKLYPYVPAKLNNILLHFTGYANVYYDSAKQIIDDLEDALCDMR